MENSSVLHFLYGANECLDADLRSQTVRVVSGRQKTGKVLGERLHSSQIRSDFAGTLFHRNKSARLRQAQRILPGLSVLLPYMTVGRRIKLRILAPMLRLHSTVWAITRSRRALRFLTRAFDV